MAKKGLGRGLDALFSDNSTEISTDNENNSPLTLRVSELEPGASQARKKFDQGLLAELAQSISLHGVIQPLLVRKKTNGFYEIIAGERRWRACKMAGISEVPVILLDVEDMEAAEISLIENLQRENLNPVEEAKGYKALIEIYDLTQEEAAAKVGKSREAVSNLMRILKLPENVLSLVEEGVLTYGHARALIPIVGKFEDDFVMECATHIIKNDLSVRETEKYIKSILSAPTPAEKVNDVEKSYYKQLEKRISVALGRVVSIKLQGDGKGSIKLNYSNTDDLESLLKVLCGEDFFELDKE